MWPKSVKFVRSGSLKAPRQKDSACLRQFEDVALSLRVALIPFTLQHTTLGELKEGDTVNLEADVIGKYVAKYMKER